MPVKVLPATGGGGTSDDITNESNITGSTVTDALNQIDTSKQNTLVSGTTIKTINSTSVLGSGDLVVGGSTITGTAGENLTAGNLVYLEDASTVSIKKIVANTFGTTESLGVVDLSTDASRGGGFSVRLSANTYLYAWGYKNSTSAYKPYCAVFSWSGSAWTVGTVLTIDSGLSGNTRGKNTYLWDSTNSRLLVAYEYDNATNVKLMITAVTISGTTCTAGTPTQVQSWATASTGYSYPNLSLANGKVFLTYANATGQLQIVNITGTGTTATVNSALSMNGKISNYTSGYTEAIARNSGMITKMFYLSGDYYLTMDTQTQAPYRHVWKMALSGTTITATQKAETLHLRMTANTLLFQQVGDYIYAITSGNSISDTSTTDYKGGIAFQKFCVFDSQIVCVDTFLLPYFPTVGDYSSSVYNFKSSAVSTIVTSDNMSYTWLGTSTLLTVDWKTRKALITKMPYDTNYTDNNTVVDNIIAQYEPTTTKVLQICVANGYERGFRMTPTNITRLQGIATATVSSGASATLTLKGSLDANATGITGNIGSVLNYNTTTGAYGTTETGIPIGEKVTTTQVRLY